MDVRAGAQIAAMPHRARRLGGRDPASAERALLAGVRDLPGVTRVLPGTSGTTRWFHAPVTGFLENGSSVQAWITIGVDRHHAAGGTVGLVGQYVRARLAECGFDLIEVRIRVAVLE